MRGLFSSEEKQEEWIWRREGGRDKEVEERDWEEWTQGKLRTECNNMREELVGERVELKQNEAHLKGCMVLKCKKTTGEKCFLSKK